MGHVAPQLLSELEPQLLRVTYHDGGASQEEGPSLPSQHADEQQPRGGELPMSSMEQQPWQSVDS